MNAPSLNGNVKCDAPSVVLPHASEVAPAAVSEAARRVAGQLDEIDELWSLLESDDATETNAGYELPAGFKLSIVIPVYNEKKTILQVIARVKRLPLPLEIIVVDDCSTDGTRGWLETLRGAPGLRLIYQPKNQGKGAALRAGFAAAEGDVVIIQDADLEYDPADIVRVIQPIVQGEADVVYGSRYLSDEPAGDSWLHRFGNRAITETSNLFTGLRLSDMETCYKAFRREVIRGLKLRQNRFGFEPEITARLARRKYRIAETPISYNARDYAAGKKIGIRDAFNALYCIVRYGIAD